MKIAISGATGFIGTHLTRYLSGQGHEVTGLGRKWFGRGNADHLAKLMEGMDVVINLAYIQCDSATANVPRIFP